MSARDESLSSVGRYSTVDSVGIWFWQFLKSELAPYPGRAWTVGRMTIAATITMVIVMTFRLPYGFLGAVYTFFLSRENPTMTLKGGIRTTAIYVIATAYTVLGVMLLVADPLTHFLFVAMSLFLSFFLIRAMPDYFTAVGFGFTLAGAIPLWDQVYLSVHQRTENTLWIGFSVVVGSAVTVVVEYVFRRFHPVTDVRQGLENRLEAVEELLQQVGSGSTELKFQKQIALFSELGTSRLRRLMLRSGASALFIGQMNTSIALLGRLVDLAASLQIVRRQHFIAVSQADRERILRLANEIATLRRDVQARRLPEAFDIPSESQPSEIPFLPEMERTVALMPHAFSGSENLNELFLPPPLDDVRQPLLVPDAFSNPEYLKFAIRGTLATMAAYIIYTAIAWPQLSTAIATCIITALSTIGSSRQKQVMRLSGAIVGGFICGIGAQVFILPYVDEITGFVLLFAVVTAISAWIATSTPRLSYLGVQMALAFYLINLQEFHFQYSLAVARDRVCGILLGLMCMWLIFDRLWVRNALQEMQISCSRSLKLMAELIEQSREHDHVEAARKVIKLRDQITDSFNDVKAQGDAVVFEFGPSRERKLKIRDDFRKWQPTMRLLLHVDITYLQYIFEKRLPDLPPEIAAAKKAFEDNMSSIARAMADEVSGKGPCAAPDIRKSADTLRDVIRGYYDASGTTVPATLSDIITLTQNLASITAPLFDDVDSTFKDFQQAIMHHPDLRPQQA